MGRKPIPKIKNICKYKYCNKIFETRPSEVRDFCSRSCAQRQKGIDKEWLDKRKKTCLEKYGEEVAFKSQIVQNKYKKNMTLKYGVDNPFKVKEFKNKANNSIKKKYGTKTASQNKKIANKISSTLKNRIIPRDNFVVLKWEKIKTYCEHSDLTPLFDEKYLKENKLNHKFQNKFKFKCNKCSSITKVSLSNGYLPTCKCSNYKGYSLIEDEIVQFLYSYLDPQEIFLNKRDLLSNRMEIDIFIPKYNLAIEVNGIYWHSESMGKYKNYHLWKTQECEKQEIKLIHVLDYEWVFKKPIIQSIILNSLGKTPHKIYARKCVIKDDISIEECKRFLNNNHLQGYIHSPIKIGLYYNDKLVSLMTFGKNRFKKESNTLELLRFCNKRDYNVIGGASKIFKYFKKHHIKNENQIISFQDRRIFNNNLYQTLGFKFEKYTPPSYFYWKNNKIKHRMSCQKHKLPKLLESFDINKTEYENMRENGWRRVWDCGNLKWKMELKGGDLTPP